MGVYACANPHQVEQHDLAENRGDVKRGGEFHDFLRGLDGIVVLRGHLYMENRRNGEPIMHMVRRSGSTTRTISRAALIGFGSKSMAGTV